MKRFLFVAILPAALVLSACSDGGGETLGNETSTPKSVAFSEVSATSAAVVTTTEEPVPASLYGVTADGLTTAVNAPITISAAEMTQGCLEMQSWAASIGITDTETILALAQMTEEDSTENFTVTEAEDGKWAAQSPSDQAAAISMINAAMSDDC